MPRTPQREAASTYAPGRCARAENNASDARVPGASLATERFFIVAAAATPLLLLPLLRVQVSGAVASLPSA